ncbi:hypothetical protein [Pontibacter sp. SGAir0037]|uniref:hypothetical protein n=1 Tax=Pontibacter sp. SGAir0037 TaxID=2571030 RepID=UPI0010CD43ED|nr:hypothetical protein [Pontibacter sp. SGAir0037]QCR23008.1 hypothetical protein C1N53_12090 [Pontibacter sp. SGAir0037]
MKKLLALALLTFGIVFGTTASGNKVSVEARAANISSQMIKELRLNNYQANKVKEINLAVIAKIAAIEKAYAGNAELIEQKCKEARAERDLALEDILSTAQYSNYFGNRKAYTQADKAYVANAGQATEKAADLRASLSSTK